jgi:hypothetical protein
MSEPQQKYARVADKDGEISRLIALLAEKETVIAKKETVIAKKETENAVLKTVIVEKETVIVEKETENTALKTVIVEKETENTALKTVIVEKETVISDLGEEERAQSLGALFDNFPSIVDHTESSAHTRTGHLEAKVVVDEEVPLWKPRDDDFWFSQRTAVFAKLPSDKTQKFVNSEDDVTTLVDLLISDVTRKLGLEAEMSFSRNVPHFDVKDDILVTKAPNKLTIGSIEVKKPGTPTDEARIFGTVEEPATQVGGEVFHQLHLTRLNGPRQSYGLLSTWNKWQLVSSDPFNHDAIQKIYLPGLANPKANSEKSSPPPKMAPGFPIGERNQQVNERLPQLQRKRRNSRVQQMTKFQNIDRVFYGSKVYDCSDGKMIGRLVATAVLLMYNSAFDLAQDVFTAPLSGPVRSVNFTSGQSNKRGRSNKIWFSFGSFYIKHGLQLDTVPAKQSTKFYLWAPLGYGDSGACCLASTSNGGATCVIKFFKRDPSAKKLAEEEGTYWQKIYAETYGWKFCGFRDLDGVSCVLMPYLREVSPEERDGLLQNREKSLLWKALSFFAGKGYRHGDLKWSHVGTFLQGTQKVKTVALFDLGRVSTLNPKDHDTWVTEAYNTLVERAGLKDDQKMPAQTNGKG